MSALRTARLVFSNEVLGLFRDRRAMFSAFVLPFAMYPLLILGHTRFQEAARDGLEESEVRFALALAEAPPAVRDRIPAALNEAGPCELTDVEPPLSREADDEPLDLARVRELLADDAHLLVYATPHPEVERRTVLHLYHDASRDLPNEASDRIDEVVRDLRTELELERREELLGEDPARGLDFEALDVSSEEDQSGAALGRFLPMLLVFSIIAGGSLAALSAFAGERENGTLETLLVQPAPSASVAWGKFVAVCATALGTLVANGASLLLCAGLGITGDLMPAGTLAPVRVLLGGLSFLPALFCLCAGLAYLSGRARTFLEGQQTLLPFTFVTVLPAALALQPDTRLDWVTAMIPIGGPALALRDSLAGDLTATGLVWMFAVNCGWAILLLRGIGGLLDAERLLRSRDASSAARERELRARTALRYGFLATFLVYVVGGALQARDLIGGLLLTLWVLLPVLAWLAARRNARDVGWVAALGLRRPALPHALGALFVAPGLSWLARFGLELQEGFLPAPKSMTEAAGGLEALEALPWPALLFLIAVSPGICEELFFRGAVLHGMARDMKAHRIVLWQALLFGLVHASVFRFLPTAILGALLAAVTLRARSLWPAVLLHATYNAFAILAPWSEDGLLWERGLPQDALAPVTAALGALGLVLLTRPSAPSHEGILSRR